MGFFGHHYIEGDERLYDNNARPISFNQELDYQVQIEWHLGYVCGSVLVSFCMCTIIWL